MAKAGYVGINGVARKLKKMYVGINGVARKLKKLYVGINGVARLWWQGNSPAWGKYLFGTASGVSGTVLTDINTMVKTGSSFPITGGGGMLTCAKEFLVNCVTSTYYSELQKIDSTTGTVLSTYRFDHGSGNGIAFGLAGYPDGFIYTFIGNTRQYNMTLVRFDVDTFTRADISNFKGTERTHIEFFQAMKIGRAYVGYYDGDEGWWGKIEEASIPDFTTIKTIATHSDSRASDAVCYSSSYKDSIFTSGLGGNRKLHRSNYDTWAQMAETSETYQHIYKRLATPQE